MLSKLQHVLGLYLVILTLLGIIGFLTMYPTVEEKIVEIKVPEQSGSFESLVIEDVEKAKDSIVYKETIIRIENEVNKKLAEQYAKAVHENDSLKQRTLFLEAIQIRRYNEVFENDKVKLSMEIETTGYLNSITPSYTIKSYSLSTTIEERKKQSIYGGVTVSNNLQLNNFEVIGNLGLKTKKNNIFLLGYGTQDNIYLTYLTTFFNF